ncbi:hypothetical protein EGW08_011167 [Elysia chlorotica]|uniref:IRF tryptophan pentad repeat domain-containing protein n=1 Tax=Elysia chlorotica TaxID=188477 RepID=A0A3S1HK31_ELYCH|nr:hypothetical protein EGW08_011167 [Elysia chlorotica]
MDLQVQAAETVEILSMPNRGGRGSPGSSASGNKRSVPMHIDYDSLHLEDKDESSKLRRPVRPVDRQRMRPWLMELLDLGNVYGLGWTNRHQGVFQISWRHASRLGWNLETDGDVFERWARHTGIYKEGDPPEPKRWKANFRCALHSLHDVVELTTALERRGRNACRTYRFLHSSDERSVSRKRAKARKAKEYHRYDRPVREEVVVQEVAEAQQAPVYEFVTTKILANEDIEPATESESEEETKHDRVIVQKLELKSDVGEEEIGLHHDHDYSVLPDKSQKTIVLRQGIGSIVLHKEVLGASDGELQLSELPKSATNLDQLASAAVSTAGWNTVLAPGLSSSPGHDKSVKHKIKTKLNAKELAAARLLRAEDERAAYSLKYLLTGNAEDADEPTTISARLNKKRKAESLPDHHHPSISVGAEETVSTEATIDGDTGEVIPYVPPKVSKVHRRTASPRILSGAKARRQRSKSEKTDSESTEPLMSSCLLLLEAATRLDNAEKDKSTDRVRTRGKGRGSARTSVTSATARASKIISKRDSESDGDSESSSPNQADDTMIITADQDLHRVLRKTLESLKNRNPKLQKQTEEPTITIEMSEDVWNDSAELRDALVVVSETEGVKGLFSGSSIEPENSPKAFQDRSKEVGSSIVEIKTDGSQEYAEVVDAALMEEAVVENVLEGEYVEMVLPGEEGVAYIDGDSVPSEIIIESVNEELIINKEEAEAENSSALIDHVPPGSILLQTGDGTPIGVIDAQGKLTAFQSAEARSVISLLTSKISTASSDASVDPSSSTAATSNTMEVPAGASTSSSPSAQESPQAGALVPSVSSVVVKQEPLDEPSISQALVNTDVVVKLERTDSTDQDSLSMFANSSTNGISSESEAVNSQPQSSKGNLNQSFFPLLLEGLTSPYTFEGIMSNFKKSLHLYKVSQKNIELFPSAKLESLQDLCKSCIMHLCLAALKSDSTRKASTTKASTRSHQSKKITVLPGVQLPFQRQQVLRANSTEVAYESKTVIDPTTPFSLGEIPLFASTKGDSDSMSPPSE